MPRLQSAIVSLLLVPLLSIPFQSPQASAQDPPSLRPPAVPLIACDPYFSVWSQSDRLWDSETTHWTGKQHRLAAIIRVDGRPYRLMGHSPQTVAAMKQQSVQVLPTRSIYTFSGAGVIIELTFTTPALPDDIAILSRPTTYVNCSVRSTSDTAHQVEFYLDAGGELATNTPDQQVTGSTESMENAVAQKIGSVTQHVLGKSGDDLRIDWGYLYVTAAKAFTPTTAFGEAETLREAFAEAGPSALQGQTPQFPIDAGDVVAAVAMPIGPVGSDAVSRYALLAYDDLYSIEYMKEKLQPYWRKDGWQAEDLITAAIEQHDDLEQRCQQFDDQLMTDLTTAGGSQYADIGALAYRQCFAAGKFVADANGQPLQFCKENHSNGCIATSDVFYPMAPQFLLLGPSLTKSVLVPFMDYAASSRWRFPFAPHDLGTYPKANGQRYGGGERSADDQMPVEECGNLLLMFGGLAKMEGNADFAAIYWKQLSQWAEYLQDKGFDPENQLCTDDFAGHMAHNVNLSAKAICGLGSYAMLCEMRGLHDEAEKYQAIAKRYVGQWVDAARDGDHFRLAFDRPGTWSQKYNLVWDRILGLNLFPQEVYETEMTFYRNRQNQFGLPLDNRSDYTKLDWVLWTATLTENRDDFAALIDPVHRFLNATPDRSPMTDWYYTSTAKKVGFTARPVVGGVFLKMLYDPKTWDHYAARDKTAASDWAPMPVPPKTVTLVPTSEQTETLYRYTFDVPSDDWFRSEFVDDQWQQGPGGLGRHDGPIKTSWDSNDIWVRRTVEINQPIPPRVAMRLWHDEDAEVYINGKQVLRLSGYTTGYEVFEVPADSLHSGRNQISIHCHQTTGGQFIDFGFDAIAPANSPSR